MLVSKIVALINKHLADELLTPTELLGYMDRVIDDINTRLNSTFPTFTEVIESAGGVSDPEYNYFPDKYIRSVVIVGTAFKFYVTDEEGNQTALQYQADYTQNLFYMERDYSFSVPVEFQATEQGFVEGLNNHGLSFPYNQGRF